MGGGDDGAALFFAVSRWRSEEVALEAASMQLAHMRTIGNPLAAPLPSTIIPTSATSNPQNEHRKSRGLSSASIIASLGRRQKVPFCAGSM